MGYPGREQGVKGFLVVNAMVVRKFPGYLRGNRYKQGGGPEALFEYSSVPSLLNSSYGDAFQDVSMKIGDIFQSVYTQMEFSLKKCTS